MHYELCIMNLKEITMESKRQAKISRLIQKELSEIFRRQTAAMGNVLVSVSAVRVSPDLSIAKAYLSFFPPEKERRNPRKHQEAEQDRKI